MSSLIARTSSLLACLCLLSAALPVGGCGSSSESPTFGDGVPNDAGLSADGEPLPPDDSGPPHDDTIVPDAGPSPTTCPPGHGDFGNVCVTVRKGASGPIITSDSKAVGIDGYGALIVAIMPEGFNSKTVPVAFKKFPSASSATTFSVDDLPKVAQLSLPKGTYYVLSIFQDAEPYGGREAGPGDYLPRMADGLDIPRIDVLAEGSVAVDAVIYPVRGINIDVRIMDGVRPLGSATGPLVARLSTTGAGPKIVGEGVVPCADLSFGKTTTMRVITTSAPSTFWLKAALYDFATGVDDPMLGASGMPAPGTITNYGGSLYASVKFNDAWVTTWHSPMQLDHVMPFTGAVPADPTPSCTSYSAAPAK